MYEVNMQLVHELKQAIDAGFERDGVVILSPMDITQSLFLFSEMKYISSCTMFDPWYNKGTGGVREDYDVFIISILHLASGFSEHMYLWGFPEILARFVTKLPEGFSLTAWLTWYYKNCPSVIRGWRSSQNACLHMSKRNAPLYPQHFLTDEQKEKLNNGKMRFIPGPSSVIEEPLIIGFVGKNEKTDHPSQKPERVYEKLILMTTLEDNIIVDFMAGSGTSGAVAKKYNRKAILCDQSDEYVRIMENRLGVTRTPVPEDILITKKLKRA